ncbi:MAG: heat-inducible transcription repressor HrcA, partial [Oscillospiraceae bacterium]|nr:heat-inducible transcription repressor HrcA [Oscillospiraceae bacterium]
MNGDELSDRKKLILKAVINAHIDNGEPVGSKFLTYNKQIALSSATIRNEMAELEELGYLEQPHTSAGRIPSEHGYRFYVNSLMESYRLTANELREMNNLFNSKIDEIDKILDYASRLMSMFTNYVSLAVKPRPKQITVVRFKSILLDGSSFLLVMITSTSIVKTRYIYVKFIITEQILSEFE